MLKTKLKFQNLKNKFVCNKIKTFFNNAKNRTKFIFSIKKSKFELYSLFPFFVGIYIFSNSKNLLCYKASNKELDKIMNSLENHIKNLEFKYQGKLNRQPIRYILINIAMG
jgi:hypothetical protein